MPAQEGDAIKGAAAPEVYRIEGGNDTSMSRFSLEEALQNWTDSKQTDTMSL